jgi:predicted tellurium resistance membrane protein TerC
MNSTLARQILLPILLIAFTDISLQLDNAIAISSVASQVPSQYRLPVLAGGVLLAAICLMGFTLIGSVLVQRFTWLKPIAGLVLVLIGAKLALDYFTSR